jgi:hypothetical protein
MLESLPGGIFGMEPGQVGFLPDGGGHANRHRDNTLLAASFARRDAN